MWSTLIPNKVDDDGSWHPDESMSSSDSDSVWLSTYDLVILMVLVHSIVQMESTIFNFIPPDAESGRLGIIGVIKSPKGNQHLAEAPAATPVLPGPGPTPVVPPAPYPGMSAAGAARMATGEARSKKVKVQEFRDFSGKYPLVGANNQFIHPIPFWHFRRWFFSVPAVGYLSSLEGR